MLQALLQQKFGIKPEEELRMGPYEACKAGSSLYLLIPARNIDGETIMELDQISQHMVQYGDYHVYTFLKTKEGEAIVDWKKDHYCVLANQRGEHVPVQKVGRKLSKFHHRGRMLPLKIQKISRIGMWKSFWEQRLDQMEKVWNDQLFHPPENEFQRLFLESFPYYMGLTENAIQYLTDTELDDNPTGIDNGTVCHVRFSQKTWGDQMVVKNPFDWVVDHCARDLAEWTRDRYFYNSKTYEREVSAFFRDYQSIEPLSSFSWRLLYARLLFPLHYFECIEEYYITDSEQQQHLLEERLKKYVKHSREYEKFLRDFYHLTEVPVKKYHLPELEWLFR
ncbi:spore coat putative kinase YutH [Bacillus dakarensis]|uniref:spore coat putative kinase YutH n=1 Tax=Robertmurraya dakarensis TaxID=1926278 RepID=UPI0009817EA9|nr:spore coat protein YutH [Bacillus dakarensis]